GGRWPAAKRPGGWGCQIYGLRLSGRGPPRSGRCFPAARGRWPAAKAAGRMGTSGLLSFLGEDQIAKRVGDVVVVVPACGNVGRRLDQGQDLVQVVVSDLFLGPRDLLEPLPGGVVGGVTRLQPQLGEPVAERATARPRRQH